MTQSDRINGIFEKNVREIIEPLLKKHGFVSYGLPNGWNQPSFLYRHQASGLWYGTSYDWRDLYYESDFGYLYRFKDVLPRVVVLGLNLSRQPMNGKAVDEVIQDSILKSRKALENLLLQSGDTMEERVKIGESEKKKRLIKYVGDRITNPSVIPFFERTF